MSDRKNRRIKLRQLKVQLTSVVGTHNKYCAELERRIRSRADWELVQQFKHPFQDLNDLYGKYIKNMGSMRSLEDQIKAVGTQGDKVKFEVAKKKAEQVIQSKS